jgi:hypothetical protein
LASTDCIVRYNRKIESVSEDRSIGPFAHLCVNCNGVLKSEELCLI